MPVNITNRADAEAIIREQIVSNIFQDAPKNSVFMGMARKLPNMTSNQTRIRVLDFLPTAYWVDGDTGMKQTTRQAWDKKSGLVRARGLKLINLDDVREDMGQGS